jgi:hypothetical protein
MTLEELSLYEPETVLIKKSISAPVGSTVTQPAPVGSSGINTTLNAFEKMKPINRRFNLAGGVDPGRKAGGFSLRCGTDSKTQIPTDIKTLLDVIEFCKKNENVSLEINIFGMNKTYVTKSSLGTDKLCVPYLWAFSTASIMQDKFSKIVAIVPSFLNEKLKRYSMVHFILENELPFARRNCCFPEFLSSEYTRVCGPAFEKLNTSVEVEIPSGVDIACGVGTNSINDRNMLRKKILLKINGVQFEVDLLK